MHIAAIYFIQRQIAAQNRYNKRTYKKAGIHVEDDIVSTDMYP